MLLKAILIGLWAGLAGIDSFDGLLHIHRPIVTGPVIGLILGDPVKGLIVGGTLELVWAGMVPLAGAQPPNVVIGGVIGTAFAILTNIDAKVAVGIAVPFAVAVQGLITLLFTAYTPVMHTMDLAALKGNYKKIDRLNYLQPAIVFVAFFLIAFLPIYFGANAAQGMISAVPQWILDGLSYAGGIMPAVGFAMLLKIMWKAQYAPFFGFGFVMAAYGQLPILGVAIVGIGIAAWDYFRGSDSSNNNGNAAAQVATSSNNSKSRNDSTEGEDFSNGI